MITKAGYETTNDDPAHADAEHAVKVQHMRALIGTLVDFNLLRTIFAGGAPARRLAIVTDAYSPECVNLVTLDDLAPHTNVVLGAGWCAWPTGQAARPVLPVFWRHASGVQYIALAIGIGRPTTESLDLLVLSNGYFDLGLGAGNPIQVIGVHPGNAVGCYQTTLDP